MFRLAAARRLFLSSSSSSSSSSSRSTTTRLLPTFTATINSSIARPNIHQERSFATDKKKQGHQGFTGDSGRIVAHQQSGIGKKKSNALKLCSGCGTEVVVGNGRNTFSSGNDAVNADRSNKQSKQARYFDAMDNITSNFLCERCKALKSDNIWKAYDALKDVSPTVFTKQLKHIVSRRQFGVCLMVADSTDAEHSAMKHLRRTIGKTESWLILNKTDLMPSMTTRHQQILNNRIKTVTGIQFRRVFAVSAVTGEGVFELAEALLEDLRGKDVFVVGAANVGKSTLVKRLAGTIAEGVSMKGHKGKKRRDMAANLQVTGSHLPGTTLQAVRIPCFSKSGHALWDTPGLINSKAIQYSIFPSHMMEPLTRPMKIPVPTKGNGWAKNVHAGQTILIEAAWMDQDKEDDSVKLSDDEIPCVLGRIDMVDVKQCQQVYAQAYLHPSLRVRIVPTSEAPDHATIPASHVKRILQRVQSATGQQQQQKEPTFSFPLKPFVEKKRPKGEITPSGKEYYNGKIYMDLSFASLGWISFTHEDEFVIIPHCVEGSVFTKRPALYPSNLAPWFENNDHHEHFDPDEQNQRLREASRRGRHQKEITHEDYDGDHEESDETWY